MKKLLIILISAIAFSGCYGKKNAVTYHKRLQKEYSFEARMNQNSAFSKANAKEALRTAKKKQREAKRKANKYAKIQSIREKTKQVKNENNN